MVTHRVSFHKIPTKYLQGGKYGLVSFYFILLISNRLGFVVSHEYANEVHIAQQIQRTSYHFQSLKNWMNGNTYILPNLFHYFSLLFLFLPISTLFHILTLLFVFLFSLWSEPYLIGESSIYFIILHRFKW